ncbi:hypothetical protein KJ975_10365 [Myxococcota bacterium]|nr:hypothetical protein [Myxococcota bacterium]
MRNVYLFIIISLSLFTLSCATAQVHRSAYVPLPQPSMRSGAPSQGRSMLTAGAMTLAKQQPVEEMTDIVVNTETISLSTGAANWVPRSQMNLNWRYRFTKNFDMGIGGEWGLAAGKQKTYTDDLNLTPKGNVIGIGLSFGYNFEIDTQWAVAISGEYLSFSVPYAKQFVDTDLISPIGEVEYGNETVGVYSFSIIPRMMMGNATVFGGVTFRNHPTAPKLEIYSNGINVLADNNVESGSTYTIITIGAEFKLNPVLRLLVMAFQPVTTSPVKYFPMFGLGLAWDMGAAPRYQTPVTPADGMPPAHGAPTPANEPPPTI